MNPDRKGILLRNSPTRGAGGAVKDNLEVVRDPYYIRKVRTSVRTVLAGARDAADLEEVFEGRWFTGVRPSGHYLRVEGVIYRITRVDELERRIGWRLYCRAIE